MRTSSESHEQRLLHFEGERAKPAPEATPSVPDKPIEERYQQLLDLFDVIKAKNAADPVEQEKNIKAKQRFIEQCEEQKREGGTRLRELLGKYEKAGEEKKTGLKLNFVNPQMPYGNLTETLNMGFRDKYKDVRVQRMLIDTTGVVYLFGTAPETVNDADLQKTADVTIRTLRLAGALAWRAEWGNPKIDVSGMVRKKPGN